MIIISNVQDCLALLELLALGDLPDFLVGDLTVVTKQNIQYTITAKTIVLYNY